MCTSVKIESVPLIIISTTLRMDRVALDSWSKYIDWEAVLKMAFCSSDKAQTKECIVVQTVCRSRDLDQKCNANMLMSTRMSSYRLMVICKGRHACKAECESG